MGYSTEFKGKLSFANDLTGSQLAYLKTILGQDIRGHKEWPRDDFDRNDYPAYIDLKITDDFGGIQWDGSEKTYAMVGCVNLVTRLMRERYPDFCLTGELQAQGESFEDRWVLAMENGKAVRRDLIIVGSVAECPLCGHKFVIEEQE